MKIGRFEITLGRKDSAGFVTQWPTVRGGGWWPVIGGDIFSGAWQRGITPAVQDVLTHPTFWSCTTLIAGDIAKCCFALVEENEATEIVEEVEGSPLSAVLERPNHYQNWGQFAEYWILCKLTRGNFYALKGRDGRGVVTQLFPIDPVRVRVLVGPEGSVFYQISQDVLSGVKTESLVVPAREILHDRFNCLYHQLVGLSPVYAAGLTAMRSLKLIDNSRKMAEQGFQPGGFVTAAEPISQENAEKFEKYWQENYNGPSNVGRVVFLGGGLKFEQAPTMSAVDAQVIEQLKWDDEKVCSTFHVPPYMVGVGPVPQGLSVEALNQQYYSQCLQVLVKAMERCLADGLEVLKLGYDVAFDEEELLRMDAAAKLKNTTDGIKGGLYKVDEGRARHNLPPIPGGDTVYLQEQDHSLEALAKRDAGPDPFGKAAAKPPTPPPAPAPEPPVKGYEALDAMDVLAETMKALEAA